MDSYYERADYLIDDAGAEVAIGAAELRDKQQYMYSWLGLQVIKNCSTFQYSHEATELARAVSVDYAKLGVDVISRVDDESDANCILSAVWHRDEILRVNTFSGYARDADFAPLEFEDIDASIAYMFDQFDNAETIVTTLRDQYFDSIMVDTVQLLRSAQKKHEIMMQKQLVNLRLVAGSEVHAEASAVYLREVSNDYARASLRQLLG